MESFEDVEDFLAGLGIQSARRLVRQNDGWIPHDGAGDGDALLLSSGEFVGFVCGLVGKPDAFEGGKGPGLALGFRDALVRERKHDLFQCRKSRNEIVSLKNESYLLAAEF